MDKQELHQIIQDSANELKNFQKATVEHVFKKLYIDGHSRHLVADEVGLGKTKIAKGLIAKALSKHLKRNGSKKPFRVVYICSNQALILKNLKDLNVLKSKEFINTNRSRLLFTALKQKENNIFQLSSLTPSTSFRLIKGTGIAEERKLIWLILSQYKVFSKGVRRNGLKLALKGYAEVEKEQKWKDELDTYEDKYIKKIRREVYKPFKAAVAAQKVNLNSNYFKKIGEELKITGEVSLQDILILYSKKLRVGNVKNYSGQNTLLGLLRKLLTEVCVKFLVADLYVLDEFQRFKELLEINSDDPPEAAVIAREVFNVKGAKVLMLSATPFKPFTTSIDETFEENHFKEFNQVLSFLFNNDQEKMQLFECNRKDFFEILRRPELLPKYSPQCKIQLERLYRDVMSRTERILVSDDGNTLLKNKIPDNLELSKQDIKDFIFSDKIIQELQKITGRTGYNFVDYSKSSPHPLSFMDRYKPKEDLIKLRNTPPLKKVIKENKAGWMNLSGIEAYDSLENIPNARMRYLLQESVYNGMWQQLWLAPSLPYYELSGSFKDAHLNSKLLLFSKWKMVPRAISALVSFESERLSIADKRLRKNSLITYTPPFKPGNKKRQPRKPTKIISLKLKNGRPNSMTAFSILYPSYTLAKFHDFKENLSKGNILTIKELVNIIQLKLKSLILQANLEKYCTETKQTVNWYWAAPILLDKYFNNDKIVRWLSEQKYYSSKLLSDRGVKSAIDNDDDNDDGDHEASANETARVHFGEIVKVFNNPEQYGFGQFPEDLYEVLALLVISSPAICSLRSILHHFQNEDINNQLNSALNIATEFYSLFDKPESISLVHLNAIEKSKETKVADSVYWRDVLQYCADGNLQSVLDEFAHLIYFDNRSLEDFSKRLGGAVNIKTVNLRIDGAKEFLDNKTYTMRCHYARDFGNQNMEQKEGRDSAQNIINNFNSPFRPFVLATTSIGQEGLDFHLYCRKIMHWNLPSNAIDLEQREGRVNRYKGLVIRQNIVSKYSPQLNGKIVDLWNTLFDIAAKKEDTKLKKSELVPYWHVKSNGIHIERIIPMLPYSKEVNQLKKLLTVLTMYRLTFGQPRQEELIEILFKKLENHQIEEIRKKLLINLSPISY